MKIVCDACGAKYSIADEKVRGKVFKIRCKRCSNIIVVRGNEEAQAPEQALDNKETRVFDYSGYDGESAEAPDAIWHVVIDQEQIGPLTVAEVAEKFRAGQLDADSYVWQEGFADWERLADVAEFATLAAGGEDAFGGPAVDESITAQNDPADLFAAAASAGPADPGADLFSGGAAASPGGGAGDALFGGAAAAPESDSASKLKGQRNENSVLFSLSNLASLASGGGSSEAASSSASSAPAGGGSRTTATQEGSGLIDIRSMAQVYLGDSGGSPSPSGGSAGTGSIDDLPSFGATSFDAPASPMLLPTAPAESDNKKILYALMGVIGVLALAAIILVVMVVKGGGDETVASAGSEVATEGTGTGDEAAKPADGEDKAAAATKDEGSAETEAGKDETAKDETAKDETAKDEPAKETRDTKTATTRSSSSSSSSSSRDRDKPKTRDTDSSPPKETTTASKPAESSSAGCDEVTCLVEPNKACCRKYRSSGGSSSKSSSGLPERPSKSDVKSGISTVMGRVRACGSKHGGSGVVKVRVKVGSSGRVESATPSPGNALGDCVASAVKGAKFPKTQLGVTFTYPFRF